MIIETSALSPLDSYKLIAGAVVPRPIAWVSTIGPTGVLNLAPFSFFNAASSQPPIVMFCVSRGEGLKDTGANIRALGEFVVNIVDMDLAEQMNVTAGDYPSEMSEFEVAGLTPAPSHLVRPPRVAAAPIALECVLHRTVDLGDPGHEYDVFFGRVVCFQVRDDLYDRGRIDQERLRPLGRLVGSLYSAPGEMFAMERPTYRP
ncbi:MAG: flavin reductase family protein [Chloroflexi bacterium]|nr:flavin reductase family protein [Chloroflexota bacterium]